jgi:hypothetical protein
MTTKYTTVTVSAHSYEDHDDCLAAAREKYAEDHALEGWQVEAHWADGSRDEIVLTVPAGAEVSS